jgi:hypothetical protein
VAGRCSITSRFDLELTQSVLSLLEARDSLVRLSSQPLYLTRYRHPQWKLSRRAKRAGQNRTSTPSNFDSRKLHFRKRSDYGWLRGWQIFPSSAISCEGSGIPTDLRYPTSTLPKPNCVRENNVLPNNYVACRAMISPCHVSLSLDSSAYSRLCEQ